jgi:hypothetical protein
MMFHDKIDLLFMVKLCFKSLDLALVKYLSCLH